MYSILWPVGISCRISDAMWEIENDTGVASGRLTLSGESDKASFLKDYGPPIDISVELVEQDSEVQIKTIANKKGEWSEIGGVSASPVDGGDLERLSFCLPIDKDGFNKYVRMAMNYWRKETHDLFITAEIFGIEQGVTPYSDRWPPDKPLLPPTSFSLFLRPKNW